MDLFSKPIARIYIEEIRTKMDDKVVPIFSPDTAIDVGDFGSFEDGQFVKKGNIRNRGLDVEVDESPAGAYDFASTNKVTVGVSVKVPNPAGGELFKSTIKFGGSKAVAASFKGGVDRSVQDADLLSDKLLDLWYRGELPTERVVIWAIRRAGGGAVVISAEGDNEVEVFADPVAVGAAGITLASLSAGVTFGAERKATWKLTKGDVPLVVWARMLRLSDDQRRVVDAFKFDEARTAAPDLKPSTFTTDDLLEEVGPADS
jgi:hypothetical protein